MPVEFSTKRLHLRPFQAEDVHQFALFANDPAYRRYLGPGHPDAAQLVLNNLAIDWERELAWVILLDGRIVGSIFLGVHKDDGTAEIACLLSPAVWGQGIALEAGRAVVEYAFRELPVQRVFARADAANNASRRAMSKGAMMQDGLLRKHRVDVSGNRVDEVLYGLNRDESQPH